MALKKYSHNKKMRRFSLPTLKFWISLQVLLIGYAIVSSVIMFSPIQLPGAFSTVAYASIDASTIQQGENQIIIPKIGVQVPLKQGNAAVMNENAWHRHPERGNPKVGGNFIVSAHRFNLGWTPQHTKAKSPFYHIDKLLPGDEIIVDFDGSRFIYQVTKKYTVEPNALYIEDKTALHRLTLYSCTTKGSDDGRDVVEATLKEK